MTTTYQPGDEIKVGEVTITLARRGSFRNAAAQRWSWYIAGTDYYSECGTPTADEAVDDAYRTLNGPRCSCGEPATMTAATKPSCPRCYDRHAD